MHPHQSPKEVKTAVVAGHICLDVIPDLESLPVGQFEEHFRPGHITSVGDALLSTGEPVSNTGLALHRLGITTQLIAKTGSDAFGDIAPLKLGDRGAYLHTADETRLKDLGRGGPGDLVVWTGQVMWAPCFEVQVVGTTGSDLQLAEELTIYH